MASPEEVELRYAQSTLPEDDEQALLYEEGEPDEHFPILPPPPVNEHADSGFFFFNSLDIPILVVVSMLKPVYCLKVSPGETKYVDCQKSVFDIRVQAWSEGSEESILNSPQPFGLANPMAKTSEQSKVAATFGGVMLGLVTTFAHVHPIALLLRAAFLIKRKHLKITDDFIVDAFANGRTVQITGKEKDGKVFKLKAKIVDKQTSREHGELHGEFLNGKDKDA